MIPLSGARVALVVGDVVGHGLQASAAMGRLRTAVRALADVDVPPDDLLAHLDDLVTHLAATDGAVPGRGSDPASGIIATCLYLVYDPVARTCTVASAGHMAPAVVAPDGTVGFVDVSPGPPLGVGGLPFETAERTLAEGSLLVLYTDGLIEACGRDIDAGLELMRGVLRRSAGGGRFGGVTGLGAVGSGSPTGLGGTAGSGGPAGFDSTTGSAGPTSLDDLADEVLRTLLPAPPTDDVALLVARTHVLGVDQVATWEVPGDPAAVAEIRAAASRRLAEWDLPDEAFALELIVSELVTNAIRYGSPPIRLRLIRGAGVICEVSDGSNSSPHLRRAQTFDEGGRGLLLVAQLARRWGTRHHVTGKTIWAEIG